MSLGVFIFAANLQQLNGWDDFDFLVFYHAWIICGCENMAQTKTQRFIEILNIFPQ